MGDTDISSLKQFGKQINKTKPKTTIKSKQQRKKEKNDNHIVQISLHYKKRLLRFKKNLLFAMKKHYEHKQLHRFLYKKQKERYREQKKQDIQVKYTFLKESKKQLGNTTIIIRKRVQKPLSKMTYDRIDRGSSNIFDIFIPDEKD